MKSNEKKLVLIAGVMFLVVLVVRGIPFLRDAYANGLEEIEFMEQRIERLQMMVEEAPFIKEEEELKRQQIATLEGWIFTGQDRSLIGTSVQRQLRQAVEEVGVTPRQYPPPRIAETEAWLVITQEVDFTIEQEDILPFLDALENSRPRLHVTEFRINRNRRQYTGSLTVTGFSKKP